MTRELSAELVTRAVAESSLEYKLTDPLAFGLDTASPLQRAICRVADGMPMGDLAAHPHVRAAIGNVAALDGQKPREVYLMSGIRTGKSLTAACGAVHMALTCDVSTLRPGEIPRVSVVSLKKDLADVILNHIVGSLKASPLLKRFLVGEPSGDGLIVRHPTGCPVEISVVAGSRAGSSLVARWSAGAIFDEAPRMIGGDEGVVNFDDMRQAVLLRLLKGCQLWALGSPWAPYGPIYEVVTSHLGAPTLQKVVIKAPAPMMNPAYWTDERVAEARKADPDAAKTDIDAEFSSPEEAMFTVFAIDQCLRSDAVPIPRKQGYAYYASMDPATRGNGWTLAIATREGGKAVIVYAHEWVGTRSEPLDPKEVLKQAAAVLLGYGVTAVHSDQAMGDALISIARDQGLHMYQWTFSSEDKVKRYLSIRTKLEARLVEMPRVPAMRKDLLHVRKVATPGGAAIKLPLTSDGRHCDWAPTLMLALTQAIAEPTVETKPTVDDETLRLRKQLQDRLKKKREW